MQVRAIPPNSLGRTSNPAALVLAAAELQDSKALTDAACRSAELLQPLPFTASQQVFKRRIRGGDAMKKRVIAEHDPMWFSAEAYRQFSVHYSNERIF
jgi:hypothetical protein